MTKSQALVPQSDSLKKKKLKHNVDEITCVQDERKEEMNDKKKKQKKKKREADDEVCEHTESISEVQSADTNTHEENTEIHKHKKKKKRKAEELETSTHLNGDQEENIHKKKKKSEVCVPVENTPEEPQDTEQLEDIHKQEDHTKRKKKKKRKHKESEAAVPESDSVTPQEEETNTHATEERAEKSTAESSGDVNTLKQEPSGVEDGNDSDGEEELSPEEKRVLERKLKKILKKEEKKRLKEEGKYTKPEKSKSNIKEKQALEYLKCWSEKREEWKFNKNSQTWLLHHMFDSVKVSDDHFEVMLLYLDGLRGTARNSTLQKAEAIVRWKGQGDEADTADAEKRKLRAKQVVQLL